MQEENALTKISKGPMHAFKTEEIGVVLEELLGRLNVLRRNQKIVYIGDMKVQMIFKLVNEHAMFVTQNDTNQEIPLLIIDQEDSDVAWKNIQCNPMVVAISFPEKTIQEYNSYIDIANHLNYIPVIISDKMLILIRSDLALKIGIKGINLRNYDIIFYDS